MDIVWLILDSLSFSATPFDPTGPETMPQLRSLAADEGVVYHESYTPGHLSMSAHGSLFTGELPSTTGMHEAHPTFNETIPTVADVFGETHRTHLITANPWLLHGLDAGFDTVDHFLNPYLIFPEATDPYQFARTSSHQSGISTYRQFLFGDGKPLRSLLNGVAYKLGFGLNSRDGMLLTRVGDEENYQYAENVNDYIRRRIQESDSSFVVANYMDAHPPFDASQEALTAVTGESNLDEFPIGVDAEQTRSADKKSYNVDRMIDLYHATIRDLDEKLTPLISDLVQRDTMVVVTADHGSFFQHEATSDGQLHVPTVLFVPGESARTVSRTVSTRSIPRTIASVCGYDDNAFSGKSLLNVSQDRTALTEIIRAEDIPADQVVPKNPGERHDIRRDVVARRGENRVVYRDGEWHTGEQTELSETVEQVLASPIAPQRESFEAYDADVQAHLEDLGYV